MSAEGDAELTIQSVLETWYAATDEGSPADLEAICHGDADLVRRVRAIIDSESAATGALRDFCATPLETALPKEQLGDFKLRAPLGAGGMGRVYLAEQVSLGRLVALKVLDPYAMGDEESRQRFRREAEIAAALDHPNIVPVYSVGEDQGFAFIAMKWLSGPGLDALEEPLGPRDAARVGVEVARALEEAHLSGVVHRDVKSANIIMDGETPCVVDFGLARGRTDITVTRQGSLPGTLPYMPPEQLRGEGAGPDARADVYSLGATLYEIVSGRLPFDAREPERLIHQILFREPPALRLPPRDRDLETIILRALEKEPERRFPTAASLARDLERYIKEEPIRSRPSGPISRMTKLVRRHRRAAMATALASLVIIVLGCVALFVVLRDQAAFASTVTRAENLLDARSLEAAEMQVSALEGEGREADLVARLRGRLEALMAIERLLDQIQDRREAQNPRELSRLEAEIHQTNARAEDPWRTGLALGAAALIRGDHETAASILGDLERDHGSRLSLAALQSVAKGRDDWESFGAPARNAEDHLFVAIARRLAQHPVERQRQDIERALAMEPENFRVKYALAIILDRQGQHESARAAIQGLMSTGVRRVALVRKLVRLHMILGDLKQAEARFDEIPESERTIVDCHQLLILRWRQRRENEVTELLDGYLARWPDEPEFLQVAARLEARAGRREHARGLLDRVTHRSVWKVHRDEGRASLLLMKLEDIPGHESVGPPGSWSGDDRERYGKELRFIEREASGLEREAQDDHPRSVALYALYKAQILQGKEKMAIEALERAIDVDPRNPNPRMEYALWAVSRTRSHLSKASKYGANAAIYTDPEVLEDLRSWRSLAPIALKGRGHAQALISFRAGSEYLISDLLFEQAYVAAAWFACLFADRPAAAVAATSALELMADRAKTAAAPRPSDAEWKTQLQQIKKWAGPTR